MLSSSNNKRQRTTTSTDSLHITNLPDGLLVGISSYLAKPSAVLFAIAISSNNSQSTQTSNTILSSIDWSVLDFGDIEKSLAAKLSDDDIDKVLKSTHAFINLRILKLAGCISITGRGLDVLRSSVAIEQIDMSLVGMHESPILEAEPLLSESLVISILDDIIGRGSSLKQLELPMKWRNAHSMRFTLFLGRYSNYLARQRHRCLKCDRICEEVGDHDEWITLTPETRWYGTQSYTCYGCLNHFCHDDDCTDEEGGGRDRYINWCEKCGKEYCKSCVDMKRCWRCCEDFCNECRGQEMEKCEAEGCDYVFCGDCSKKNTCSYCNKRKCESCSDTFQCSSDSCNKVICGDCVVSKGEGGRCIRCTKSFCSTECRYLACNEDETEACPTCLKSTASSFRRKFQECLFGQEILTLEVGEEPTTGDIARVQIKMPDGTRLVRKFAGDSPVKLIYAFVAQSNDDAKGGKAFKLTAKYPPIDLFANRDDGIKSCGLNGEAINVIWK